MSPTASPEQAFVARVVTPYRLFDGLFRELPFESVRHAANLLPLFAEYCKEQLAQSVSPHHILETFFSSNPVVADLDADSVRFLFLQLIERQIVLFDAIEEAEFSSTHDLEAAGSVSELLALVDRESLREELGELLGKCSTRIVLTAHPTQFYPEAIRGIIDDLKRAITRRDLRQIETLLLQLGMTRFTNRARPTPVEEAAGVLAQVDETFYELFPEIEGRLLRGAFGAQDFATHLPPTPLLELGFWPGGDRDGNPFVTAEITREVGRMLRERVLQLHLKQVASLSRRLTFEGVRESLAAIEARLHSTWLSAAAQGYCVPATESHAAPSKVSLGPTFPAYDNSTEALHDVLALRERVLREHHGLFLEQLDNLLLSLHVFGFHFASLDLRQDSSIYCAALRELAQLPRLASHLASVATAGTDPSAPLHFVPLQLDALPVLDESELAQLSAETREQLDTLRLIPELQRSNGHAGLHRIVISHTRDAADVLAVLVLAALAGVAPATVYDVVPLFESIEDLQQASATLEQLYAWPSYRQRLQRASNSQTVMVGFSDGTKDGGYLAANVAIRQAKREMTALSRAQGLRVVFFDGRGGPPARGGGNTHRFYRSRDTGIEQWSTQLTIQGQTIGSQFSGLESARFHLEQLCTANLENLLDPTPRRDPPLEHQPLLDELSADALAAYRELRDSPAFLDYLDHRSALPLFDSLTIASRPARRKRTQKLELSQLRAIPFVASWSIDKLQLPGFYGLGTALNRALAAGKGPQLRQLHRDSRYFRTLLDNAAMSLLKSRLDLTSHLKEDPRHGPFWCRLREEITLTEKGILAVSGQPRLLATDPVNRLSIAQREEILLPLLVVLHDSLARWQQLRDREETETPGARTLAKAILKGMAAVINATRNAA